jgi:hypothetical protein
VSGSKTKTKYTSKGERKNVSPAVTKAVKRDRTYLDKMVQKQKAWAKGQNPWITVPNINTAQTNKKMVRVRANSEWGDPKDFVKILGRAQ